VLGYLGTILLGSLFGNSRRSVPTYLFEAWDRSIECYFGSIIMLIV
jgi:hypothetical protein